MNAETKATGHCRVWGGSLGAYNDGRLLGVWINAEDAEERVPELIKEWQASDPIRNGDEWFIADHEGFGPAWPGGENPYLDKLRERAEELEALGDSDQREAYKEFLGLGLGHTIREFQEAYLGPWDSQKAFAENEWQEHCEDRVPEDLQQFVDLDAYTSWLSDIGYTFVPRSPWDEGEHGVFVFRQ